MTTKEYKFSNGDKVKEIVTGFTGVITGPCHYITGCNTYLVVAKVKDEFSTAKTNWYDEGRLGLIQEETVKSKEVKAEKNGCDREAPNKG